MEGATSPAQALHEAVYGGQGNNATMFLISGAFDYQEVSQLRELPQRVTFNSGAALWLEDIGTECADATIRSYDKWQ